MAGRFMKDRSIQEVDTHEVFENFFSNWSEVTRKKIEPSVNRPEVYTYEMELGKKIFEMNVDELFGMIETFGNKRACSINNSFRVSYSSYDNIASLYRSIWEFYIEDYTTIKNPWNRKEMKGAAAAARIAQKKERFSFEVIDKAIKKLNEDYSNDNYTPKYVECLLLLFYNGFAEAQEIVLLKEDMINFKTQEIRLSGRTLKLSDRCFELLQYVHNLDEIDTQRGSYKAVPYKGGYFKFVVRARNANEFQKKTLTQVGAVLTRKITKTIKQEYGIDISYRMVYLLGFYDYIVSKSSEERARELILSVRNSADAHELLLYAREYGVVADNVSYIKRILRPFI